MPRYEIKYFIAELVWERGKKPAVDQRSAERLSKLYSEGYTLDAAVPIAGSGGVTKHIQYIFVKEMIGETC